MGPGAPGGPVSLPDLAAWRARGERVSLHGHSVFAVDEGPRGAPTLLYLHGYPTSSHDLAPALPRLRARHRVIAHDHLGFGLSDKPADYGYALAEQADQALALWRHLGVRRAHLIAHDYGTSVATELLARRERGLLPIALDSVTLCNGSLHIDLADLRWIQVLLRNPWTGPLAARLASRALFARNLRAILARPAVLDDPTVDAMWSLLAREDGRLRMPQITRYLQERRRFRHRWIGALTRLDLPCHVLWGRQDPVAAPAIGQAVADETPGAALTWLDGLGHYPMLEDPEAWASAVLGFVDSVEAAAGAPAPGGGGA